MRKTALIHQLSNTLGEISGIEMDGVAPNMSFIEIGLDSLLLTQVALLLKKHYQLPISFRQLNEEFNTLDSLATYLDQHLPAEEVNEQPLARPEPSSAAVSPPLSVSHDPAGFAQQGGATPTVVHLIAQQIQLLAQQVAILSGQSMNGSIKPAVTEALQNERLVENKEKKVVSEAALNSNKPAFGAMARIEKNSSPLSKEQADYLIALTKRYTDKTRASKAYTQQHRAHMADPRVVSGFKPLTKELVYPIVTNHSKGSRVWDIDGNEYIDLVNGFGSNLLGYQPDHIKVALHDQIEKGFEIGPQHELAGQVSELFCKMTHSERAAFCNTGSEAVLGAVRIARTVTGKSLIVSFTNAYHGINDEALVRGSQGLKSVPAAPGVMPEAVLNTLVLPYGSDESLRIIKERKDEIAAVLVEPIQSRNPEFQPVDFLKEVREFTEKAEIVLIFDEVITGFRLHQGGAQALFGIQADMGTYGKVLGAGISIGVIAGKKKFLDALDGGFWQYGDASIPEVGVTYFAGTFVRHPLALAAAKASLLYMKEKGNALQEEINQKSDQFAHALNAVCTEFGVPLYVAHFGSILKLKNHHEYPYSELIYVLMREKGIHIIDGFPCYITEALTDHELTTVVQVFTESIQELLGVGFLPTTKNAPRSGKSLKIMTKDKPPVPQAKLGKDANGNPAWFIADPEREGKYLQIEG